MCTESDYLKTWGKSEQWVLRREINCNTLTPLRGKGSNTGIYIAPFAKGYKLISLSLSLWAVGLVQPNTTYGVITPVVTTWPILAPANCLVPYLYNTSLYAHGYSWHVNLPSCCKGREGTVGNKMKEKKEKKKGCRYWSWYVQYRLCSRPTW